MDAKQSILKHMGLAGVLKGYGVYDNVIQAMEDYAQERVKNHLIPNVAGKRELLIDFQNFVKENWTHSWDTLTSEQMVNAFIEQAKLKSI